MKRFLILGAVLSVAACSGQQINPGKMVGAAAGALVGGYAGSQFGGGAGMQGDIFFAIMSWACFGYCLLSGLWTTTDSLTREKPRARWGCFS